MLSTLQRAFKKRRMLRAMSNGYPETSEPYVPPLLKHAESHDLSESKRSMLKLTYASEGLDLVKRRSLTVIQNMMLIHFGTVDEIFSLLIQIKEFPPNLVAVSFSMSNFKVGDASSDFFPFFKNPKDVVLSYQRISANIQATFYHDGGTKFLAGMCYYPVPHKNPKFVDLDWKLINLTKLRAEPFPLGERKSGDNFIRHKAYGRFCEEAGRKVLVDFNTWPRHKEFDFKTKDYKYVECEECARDFREYKRIQEQNLRPCRRYVLGTVWARSSAEAREIDGYSELSEEDLEDAAKEIDIPEYPTENGESVFPVPDVLPGEIVFVMSLKGDEAEEEVESLLDKHLKNNSGLGEGLKEKKSENAENRDGDAAGAQPCSSGHRSTSM